MTISYPLTPPTLKHTSVQWPEENVVGISESPLSLKQDIHEWEADRWRLVVQIDPLNREEASEWAAFLSALRGKRGTFWYGDEVTKVPRGAGGGTPKVKGAGQAGYILETDGFPNNLLVLKANDRFQVGNHLYKVTKDATTNGSGEVALDIWPSLRGANGPADDADLILTSPKTIFRLSDNVPIPDNIDRNEFWNISFQAEEAI